MVGNCSGFGHDYDTNVIAESNFFVISDITIEQLKIGIKSKCIMDFEQIRNKALTHGNLPNTMLISETTFCEYMKKREQFQRKEIKMNIYEWEVKNE
jgi:hypothetical protein